MFLIGDPAECLMEFGRQVQADLVARQSLYLDLAKRVWSPTLIQSVMEDTP